MLDLRNIERDDQGSTTDLINAGKELTSKIKEFFINGEYQLEVYLPESWGRMELGIIIQDVVEYLSDWFIDIDILCQNISGSWELIISDYEEEA